MPQAGQSVQEYINSTVPVVAVSRKRAAKTDEKPTHQRRPAIPALRWVSAGTYPSTPYRLHSSNPPPPWARSTLAVEQNGRQFPSTPLEFALLTLLFRNLTLFIDVDGDHHQLLPPVLSFFSFFLCRPVAMEI